MLGHEDISLPFIVSALSIKKVARLRDLALRLSEVL